MNVWEFASLLARRVTLHQFIQSNKAASFVQRQKELFLRCQNFIFDLEPFVKRVGFPLAIIHRDTSCTKQLDYHIILLTNVKEFYSDYICIYF